MKNSIYLVLAFFLVTAGIQAQKNENSKKNANPEENGSSPVAQSKENGMPYSAATMAALEKVFYANAKRAELTDEKTKELIKIIDERNKVLKDLDTRKKQANVPFSIQDPGTYFNFKINEARNDYAKKIASLLTYKQYCYFVVDDYREEALASTNVECGQLARANPDLTKEQKLQLTKLIYNYQLNQLLTAAYFSFDKNLQKPKLGVMRFNYEKEFTKICQEYNIKTVEAKESNTNNFQWN